MCASYPLDWKLWTLWGELELNHRANYSACRLIFSAAAEALDIGETHLLRLQGSGLRNVGAFFRLRRDRVRLKAAWGLLEWGARNHHVARQLWGEAERKVLESSLAADPKQMGAQDLFWTWTTCELANEAPAKAVELAERAYARFPDSLALGILRFKVRLFASGWSAWMGS